MEKGGRVEGVKRSEEGQRPTCSAPFSVLVCADTMPGL